MKLLQKSKFIIYVLFTLLLSICFLSCTNEEASSLIDLTVDLNTKAKTNSSRDFSPSDDELTVFKFKIDGVGPDDNTFSVETTESSTTLKNLIKGKWEISVVGYNINDEIIVEGSGTYYLFNSKSVVNITLDYIEGTGNFVLDLYWNPDQTEIDTVSVLTDYYKLENNELTPYIVADNFHFNCEEGTVRVTTPLEAGSYILTSKLMNGTTEISGFAEQIRILANHTTTASNTFIIGDTQVDYGIYFYCNTYLPITGVITSSPEIIVEGENITLTFTPTDLPEGYTSDQIKYSWYLEGDLIENENNNVLTIEPLKGKHRYDLFAYIDGIEETLGSATIFVTYD